MKKEILILGIIIVLCLIVLTLTRYGSGSNKNNKDIDNKHEVLNNTNKQGKFEKHKAKSTTQRVGGLIPYNIKSDLINEIPEEYFLNLDKNMTYEELISEIGEPSGTVGSGIVRDYWRIDENKYAACQISGYLHFEIWSGND